ncbi:MAG: alpha/beta fold hydrolase [Acidobacteriia bacterium]|nr:alpha/beta fold hydrolase [Terriglobia bacterium]
MTRYSVFALLGVLSFSAAQALEAEDSTRLLRVDHYVGVHSTVPVVSGQTTQIYVREVTRAGTVLRDGSLADRVLLFVHGAGTPAEVSFDVPYEDYSWMGYLANAGFDVFAMDMTGYGRSTRPAPMNDPCNLSKDQQTAFVPRVLAAPCSPSYSQQLTTIASDWNDIGTVVDHIRALRRVDRVSMLAWSLGGPRAGAYAVQHPDKVEKLVLLAPAYNRTSPSEAPAQVPAAGATMNTQSDDEFTANWNRQVGCADQYSPAVRESVWSEMIASDPVGATWGNGVRRAPQVTTWGWNTAMVSKARVPTLMVSGAHDKQVAPDRVRDLYNDLGSSQKIFVDLACSSHNAMWEKNHQLLFQASLEWLTRGSVNGKPEGMLRLGY